MMLFLLIFGILFIIISGFILFSYLEGYGSDSGTLFFGVLLVVIGAVLVGISLDKAEERSLLTEEKTTIITTTIVNDSIIHSDTINQITYKNIW